MFKISFNPITKKRFQRFRRTRRAWWSLWLMVALYALGLVGELICNSNPYIVRFEGKTYYPFLAAYNNNFDFILDPLNYLKNLGYDREDPANAGRPPSRLVLTWGVHPEDTFLGTGVLSPPDYKAVARSDSFTANPENAMLWAPVPFGPDEIAREADHDLSKAVTVTFAPYARSATIDVTPELEIVGSTNVGYFFDLESEREARGKPLTDFITLPSRIQKALELVFTNQTAPAVAVPLAMPDGRQFVISMLAYTPREQTPRKRQLRIAEPEPDASQISRVVIDEAGVVLSSTGDFWGRLGPDDVATVQELVRQRRDRPMDSQPITLAGETRRVSLQMEDFIFPFRPIGRHLMGIDASGRDVFARIVFAMRIAMNFGFMLVAATFALGIFFGAVQGYLGGLVDIAGQRLIEIWSALPFLYMIILFGSVFGRSFILLLVLYAVFNWVGISYYMRAEFLKLRQETYVDAARVMGISNFRIAVRHILPNALVPIITFFPFSLVAAIGALSALDYLGFGLPPPTPSWGELLGQYQGNSGAWWLVIYPFAILFIVVLLGVLVGDGIRNAFDPRSRTHLE